MMEYGFDFGVFGLISSIVNLIFGSGLVISLFTLRSYKRKAKAEAQQTIAQAESTELDNIEKAIKIWREMAENFKDELKISQEKYEEVLKEVSELKEAVKRLNVTNRKILKLLATITHENFENVAKEIRDEIEHQIEHQIE